MKKKLLIIIPILLLFCAVLGGWLLIWSYGQSPWKEKSDEPDFDEAHVSDISDASQQDVQQTPSLSPLESDIAAYELMLLSQETAENYIQLADYYRQAGLILKQRDALERAYRLSGDGDIIAMLRNIVVNTEEENNVIQQEAERLLRNLSVSEYQAEAAGMLLSPDWFSVMMPRLLSGQRNYYMQHPVDGSILYIEAGFDTDLNNIPYTKVWYTQGSIDEVTYLYKAGSAVQLLKTELFDGQYNGEFTSLLCIGDTGTIYMDSGVFEDGIIVGDITVMMHSEGNSVDVFSLFFGLDTVELQEFTGTLDADGAAQAAKPDGIKDTQTAYAYNSDDTGYLYYVFDADEDGAVDGRFDYRFFGLSAYPQFSTYTPVPDKPLEGEMTIDLSQVQVRVNDFVIEWFDGEVWYEMGSVLDYIRQDPYYNAADLVYSIGVLSQSEGDNGDDEQLLWYERRGVAKVPPKATPRPRQTPKPTPTPTPKPSAPSAPSGPATGNDGQDIQWSPDLN